MDVHIKVHEKCKRKRTTATIWFDINHFQFDIGNSQLMCFVEQIGWFLCHGNISLNWDEVFFKKTKKQKEVLNLFHAIEEDL